MSAAPQQDRETLMQLVQGEDFDQAVMALMELAALEESGGDAAAAEDAYREVLASGHEGQSARAAYELARLLEARGESGQARAAYRHLLAGGPSEYAGPAVCALRRLDREPTGG